MHSDTMPDELPGGHRMRAPRPQGDGRKPLPHIITALLSVTLSLLAGHYSHILQGKTGPAGTTTVISKVAQDYGICEYFGPDHQGRTRLQLTSPVYDQAGSYCKRGTFVAIAPGK